MRQNARSPWQVKCPPPLFQEWFGLNRNLNSHFEDKKVLLFLGGGDSSFKDVVTRRGNSFLASSVIFLFFLQIHTWFVVNRKARTLYHNKMPMKALLTGGTACLISTVCNCNENIAMHSILHCNENNQNWPMRGNTPFWDGVKRPSGCYVTFNNKKTSQHWGNFGKQVAG